MIISSPSPTETGSQTCVRIIFIVESIGNSLQNDKFQTLVSKRLLDREECLLKSQKMTMEVDPEFAKIFINS